MSLGNVVDGLQRVIVCRYTYGHFWGKICFIFQPFLKDLALNDSNGQPPRHRAVSSTHGLTTVTAMKKNETWSAQPGMEKMRGQTVPTKHLDPGCCKWIPCNLELEHLIFKKHPS